MSGTNSTTEEPQEQQNREDGGDKAVVANDTSQAPNSTTDAAKVTKYRALMTYSGTEDRKITFRKDDPLTVLEKGADGWWLVETWNEKQTWVPKIYLMEEST